MKFFKLLTLISLLGITSCAQQNKAVTTHWYKGNLHTHSYWSDGDEFPEVIMDWYKANNYNFVALSDHNTLAEGEKWVNIREDSIYQDAFNNYLKEYGSEWIDFKDVAGKMEVRLKTLAEYRGRFEVPGQFLIIQAEEITDQFEDKPIHLNATNIQKLITPQGGNSVAEVLQNNIDAVNSQRQATGTPMIPHVNHPNFGYALSLADMVALSGERFFEVYNGHPMVHNLGDSLHISTEEMWDLININYLENNKPLMYGLATDDSHHYHNKGSKWSNAGRGWIMVRADSLNPKSLINNMEKGDFYASTGVELKHLKVEENKYLITVSPETGVSYQITFIGCRKGQKATEELMVVDGHKASFEITDDLLFVRGKITSSKLHANPIEDLLYQMAWTQPVLVNQHK